MDKVLNKFFKCEKLTKEEMLSLLDSIRLEYNSNFIVSKIEDLAEEHELFHIDCDKVLNLHFDALIDPLTKRVVYTHKHSDICVMQTMIKEEYFNVYYYYGLVQPVEITITTYKPLK